MARRKRRGVGGDAVAGFASGFNEGLTSVIRAKYYAALAAKAENAANPNDPFGGYGPKKESPSFFSKLFGSDKPAEGAVPLDFNKNANEAYRKARDAGDITAAETILKNTKRYNELPDPDAKPAPKPAVGAAKPAAKPAPKPEEGDKGPGYNLPAPDSWRKPPEAPAAKPLPQGIEYRQDGTEDKPAVLQDVNLKDDESALPIDKKEDEPKLIPTNLTVPDDDNVEQYEVATGGLIGEDTEEEPESALPMKPPAQPPVVPELDAAPVTSDGNDTDPEDMVTSEMSKAAMPGYAAGLRRVSATIRDGEGGIGPNPAAASYARNDGAATHDDVAVLDKMVDPEGKLPAQARSAARIAAVWDFYGDKDPDKAAELAQSLLLYDRKNSQTRGVMAMQALKDGDTQSAVKLIGDAFHNDLPDDAKIIPAVMQDGSVTAKVMRDGKVVSEDQLTPDQVQAVVQQVASGRAYDSSAMNLVTRWEANKKDSATRARGGNGGGVEIDNDIRKGLLVTRRAYAQALADQPGEGASEEDRKNWQTYFNQIKSAVQTQEERAQEYALTQKNPDKYLKALGIGSVPTTAVAPKGMGAAGKKAEAEQPDEVETLKRRIQNAYILEQHGVRVDENGKAIDKREAGYKPTDDERKAAAESIKPLRQRLEAELAAKSYESAPVIGNKTDKYEDREDGLRKSLRDYLTDLNPNKKEPVVIEPTEERRRLRLADRLLKKNDVNPYDVFEFIDKAEKDGSQAMAIDPRTGKVVLGDTQLYVDRQTLGDLARARGKTLTAAKDKEETTKAKGVADYNKSIEDSLLEATRGSRDSAIPYGTPIAMDKYQPPQEGYTPQRPEDISDARDRLAELDSKIEGVKARMHPSQRGAYNPALDQLESEAALLRHRLARVGNPAAPGAIPMTQRDIEDAQEARERLNRDYPVQRQGVGINRRRQQYDIGVQIP